MRSCVLCSTHPGSPTEYESHPLTEANEEGTTHVTQKDLHDKAPALAASVLALAVGGLMLGTASGCKSHSSEHTKMETSSMAKHACKGMNACKGQGGCMSGASGCAGKNTCKGMGGCATVDKHGCKGMNTCKGLGGCKSGDNGCAGKNSGQGK